jgi:competence protein ComEA
MTPDKLNRLWLLFTGLLILIILVSLLVIWLGRDKGQEIILSPSSNMVNSPFYVSIEGAVANPGSFPLRSEDTLSDLIDAAGGFTQNADYSNITIMVPQTDGGSTYQKVDINRAEVWLLQALPDIGEVRALAIVDYRTLNGPFRNIEEMINVPGLSQSTFNKIKAFITISD